MTRNSYGLGLFNGDVGIIAHDPTAGGSLRAVFRRPTGALRWLSPSRLPAHETVWAMTVHKSQGSEFDEVVVVLPDAHSALLSRELLYTAVTRARQRVTVVGPDDAIRAAVRRRVSRGSGLVAALRERLG